MSIKQKLANSHLIASCPDAFDCPVKSCKFKNPIKVISKNAMVFSPCQRTFTIRTLKIKHLLGGKNHVNIQ